MTDFLPNLTSPAWWLGVVVVGILVNFASSGLVRLLGSCSRRVARWSENRSVAAAAERAAEIEFAMSGPAGLALVIAKEHATWFGATIGLLISLCLSWLALRPAAKEVPLAADLDVYVKGLTFFASALVLFVGLFFVSKGFYFRGLLIEVELEYWKRQIDSSELDAATQQQVG